MSSYYEYPAGPFIQQMAPKTKTVGMSFNKTREGGVPFGIHRPAFNIGDAGEYYMPPKVNLSGLMDRTGLGNKEMHRDNFETPDILPRQAADFDKLNAIDIAQFGQKIQLGDKTVERLFNIQAPDENDKEWVDEYKRRLAAGETKEQLKARPPLGRVQRTTTISSSFATVNADLSSQLNVIKAAVQSGFADSKHDIYELKQAIVHIVGDINNLKRLTRAQYDQLISDIQELQVSNDWRTLSSNRIINHKEFRANSGNIVLFLLSHIPSDRSVELPLISWNTRLRRYEPVSILQLGNLGIDAKNANKRRYLDLQDRTIDTLESLSLFGKPIPITAGVREEKYPFDPVDPIDPFEDPAVPSGKQHLLLPPSEREYSRDPQLASFMSNFQGPPRIVIPKGQQKPLLLKEPAAEKPAEKKKKSKKGKRGKKDENQPVPDAPVVPAEPVKKFDPYDLRSLFKNKQTGKKNKPERKTKNK